MKSGNFMSGSHICLMGKTRWPHLVRMAIVALLDKF